MKRNGYYELIENSVTIRDDELTEITDGKTVTFRDDELTEVIDGKKIHLY